MSFASGMKTTTGEYKFDYNSIANKPKMFTTVDVDGTPITASEEFDSFSLVAGNNIKLTVNADDQVEVSTPLKADELVQGSVDGILNSICSDETKKSYGLTSINTVDDVLRLIANENQSVGTLKTSVRTDLSDKWLECDGSTFAKNDYPELAKMFPSWFLSDTPYTICTAPYTDIGESLGEMCRRIVNGYYIVAPRESSDNYFYYSTSPEGPWTRVSTFGEYWHVKTFGYANGLYYYACGNSGDTNYFYICTSSDIGSGWTRTRAYSSSNFVDIFGIVYCEPYWLYNTTYNNYRYGTTIDSMIQPAGNAGMQYSSSLVDSISFFTANGYIIDSIMLYDNPEDPDCHPITYYSTDPTQNFNSISNTLIVGYVNNYFVEYVQVTDESWAYNAKYDIYLSKTPGSRDILIFEGASIPLLPATPIHSDVIYIESLDQYWIRNDGKLNVPTNNGWEIGDHNIGFLVGNEETGFITNLGESLEYIKNFEERNTLPVFDLGINHTYIKGK